MIRNEERKWGEGVKEEVGKRKGGVVNISALGQISLSLCVSECEDWLNYTVKKFNYFPVLSQDVTNQTLPGREKFNYSWSGRVWLVTSLLGTGKSSTFFYSVCGLFILGQGEPRGSLCKMPPVYEVRLKCSGYTFHAKNVYLQNSDLHNIFYNTFSIFEPCILFLKGLGHEKTFSLKV
jgi:hypothetical protein